MPHALIVDDHTATRAALAEVADLEGFTTTVAGTLAEAREKLAERPPHVLLIDLQLPDGQGLDLLQFFESGPRPEVILITGNASLDSAVEALRTGVLDYLVKPVDVPRLKTVLANVTRTLALKSEIGQLRGKLRELGRFGSMIGSSPAMQTIYDLISRVAPTEATVLLTGESGTGKELAAETLHTLSSRFKGPFVPVNCSAVPSNLIESELFGHERGSFTGATQQHRGLFERATGGTLFLDEITEMPAELQAKLLRVLETRTVHRVGGEQAIAVDVRLVAATNRPPQQAVADGVLREDLYYRLNVFPIDMPPLRARGRDVDLLADYFLERLNQAEGTSKTLSPEGSERLHRHSWPGNVRELKNAVQREFIMAEATLEFEALGSGNGGLRAPSSSQASRTGGPAPHNASLTEVQVGLALDEVERRMIVATLDHCGGDKRRTAEMLGISLKTLYNRLNQYSGRVESKAVSTEAPR